MRETLHKQTKNCVFMTGSQHFSVDDIQFQLFYDGVNVPSPVTLTNVCCYEKSDQPITRQGDPD